MVCSLNQVLLRQEIRVGADLDAWLAHGGGDGLKQALAAPGQVIAAIEAADLRGMGGAGFATCRKWAPVAAATAPAARATECPRAQEAVQQALGIPPESDDVPKTWSPVALTCTSTPEARGRTTEPVLPK